MNEYSSLCLAVIAQAVEDVQSKNGIRRDALRFLMDEDRLFFFIDAGELDIKIGKLQREMHDKQTNKQHVKKLKQMMRAAL